MFCTRCGHENPADARFCARCGAQLHRPGEPVAGERVSPARDADPTATSISLGADLGDVDEPFEQWDSGIDNLPPGSALLVVKRGPNAGSRFLLDEGVTTAGRHPESDIFLDDVTVSRRHAEFRGERGVYTVHDVGSLNGTYLNRRRIDTAELTNGDEVQIGKFRLLLLSGPPLPAGRAVSGSSPVGGGQ